MSLVTDTLQSSIMHLSLSISETRVVCGGIPFISMVSVVASHGHHVRTYGADGIFLVKKLCILPNTFDEGFFSKNLHDRQKRQRTFSLNKICYHLVLLLMTFFPLSNFELELFYLLLAIILTRKKIKVRRGHCKLFFRNW